MRKIALVLLALLSAIPAFGQGGIANFPQTVPPNTVVGRLGISPGPTSAIPISQLAAVFGAKQSFTVNAKCDGATDDTAAINADLAQGGYWTVPPGRTCNATQLNITQSGTRISGAGFNSSIIQGTTANAPTINVSATLSNVYLDGFQVTKSVTATSGGTGIKFNGDCQYCVIDGLYVQKSWVGMALQSTGIGYMRHVLVQYNLNDGISFTNSAVSGTLQWDLDDVFSGQNASRGFVVGPGVAGPTGITFGSWHNVRTFANTGVGVAIACSVSIPCSGFRLTKGLIGQDNNHEIFLDTYGGLHTISGGTYVELAGTSASGPTFATPPNNTGDGIRITANNLDVSIGDVYANGNHDSGINTSATVSTNVSGFRISNHGLYGILAADCAKLTVTSVNFVSNTSANIQCTTNNGGQLVATSTPASLNTSVATSTATTYTKVAAPSAPAAGFLAAWADSTNNIWSVKDSSGTVSNTVVPSAAVANQFMTGIGAGGVITRTTLASPGAIGGTTPAAGAFTTVTGSGLGRFGPGADASLFAASSAIYATNAGDTTMSVRDSTNHVEGFMQVATPNVYFGSGTANGLIFRTNNINRFTLAATTGTTNFLAQVTLGFGTPTIASGACGTGTNGVVTSGTNQSGLITIGAAATTTCTVSFSTTLDSAPSACMVTPQNSAGAGTTRWVSSISTTAWVLSGTALASGAFYYHCI